MEGHKSAVMAFGSRGAPGPDFMGQDKEEGLKVEVHWEDADSSSAKGFLYSYSDEDESKVMFCGGYVGRAHGKKLQELQTKSTFTKGFIDLHKKEFPQMESLKCVSSGKHHSFVSTRSKPACGCLLVHTKCQA